MPIALATFIVVLFLSAGLACLAWVTAWRLFGEDERRAKMRWLTGLTIKGLIFPAALWALLNIGLSEELGPLMPSVQAAKVTLGPWMPAFLYVMAAGVFAICSYWTAIALGWMVLQLAWRLRGPERRDLGMLCVASFAGMAIPAAILLWIGGSNLAGLAATALLLPVTAYAPTMFHPKKLPPMYARAIAKMKFGKYSDAEWEIIRELEKREDDFDGWMMLAELYAKHYHDVGEAEQTILEICEQPRVTPSQAAIALQKLADWHLELAGDPEAAGRALNVICHRFPGTHLARIAQARLGQLPRNAQELRERREVKPVPLPALGDRMDASESADSGLDAKAAGKLANQLSDKLREEPNDVVAREKLARVLAENLGKAEMAIEQLGLLLDMPDQPPPKRAEWLSLVAAWQFRYRKDEAGSRGTLQRLVRQFPDSPQAFAAKQRLNLMDIEDKIRAAGSNSSRPKEPPRLRVDV